MAKKKVQDQGAQIPRNAAQHRYWTFYEAINNYLSDERMD